MKKLVLLVAMLAIGYAVTATRARQSAADSPEPAPAPMKRASLRAAEATWTTATLPDSLAGTDPDGDLSVPVSRGTIRLFDYYLATLGETDLAGVRALVTIAAERQGNATEVLALFDRYVAYLEDLRDTRAPTIDDYFAETLALQARYFGADAEALFGDDNRYFAQLNRDRDPEERRGQ